MQMQVALRHIDKLTTSTPFAADLHDGYIAPDAERILPQMRRPFEISLLDEIRVVRLELLVEKTHQLFLYDTPHQLFLGCVWFQN